MNNLHRYWVKGLDFTLQLIKNILIKEDRSTVYLYLVLYSSVDYLYVIYQKRWKIEVYHKSIKQNASLIKPPAERMIFQSNHIFSSLVVFYKLELIKIQTATNHFALKFNLLVKAKQAAFLRLNNLRKSSST